MGERGSLNFPKTPNPVELKRRCQGYSDGTKWRERSRKFKKFKPFLPSGIMGKVRSQVDQMDELGALTRTW